MKVDAKLITSCIKKDRRAQSELYELCYVFLMGIGLRYKNNREDAAALVNGCFLKVLTKLEKYKESIPFELWIRRIMINCIIDEFRSNKKEKEQTEIIDFATTHEIYEETTINDYVKHSNAEYIYLLIKELPPMSQRVFNLYVIDGFSHKEIGALLKINEGTSKWHLNFARTKLKEQILKSVQISEKVAI